MKVTTISKTQPTTAQPEQNNILKLGTTNLGQADNKQGTSTATTTSSRPNSTMGHIVIPYTKGLAESFKHTCGKYGIQTYFKGNTTIKQVLMKPKNQDPKEKKSGVIYSFQCNHITCNEEYIGETGMSLGERCKEHLKHPPSTHTYNKQDTLPQKRVLTS